VGVIGDLGGEWEKEGDLEGRLEVLLGVEVAVAKGILTLVHCSLIRGLVARGHVCVYVSPVHSPLPLVFFLTSMLYCITAHQPPSPCPSILIPHMHPIPLICPFNSAIDSIEPPYPLDPA
jgi:hypothetical protein